MGRTAAAPLGVGLLGLGVVGRAVYDALERRADVYQARAGRPLQVRAAAVRDLARRRDLAAAGLPFSVDPLAVVEREDVDLVVELMGGETPAADCIEAALSAGKSVVTANKEVMAKHGPALLALAERQGVALRYEASVGGGIPIIGVLQSQLQANQIESVRAIINGTTNYMITEMSSAGRSYDAVLAEAQQLGYAEADPSSDVDGVDAAYKLAILASLAFGARVAPDRVYREGIRALTARDFEHARNLGYIIRMLATARRTPRGLDLRVHPTLIPQEDPMARVDGVLNAVAVTGDLLGSVVLEGPGAGAGATASAVVADILDAARTSRRSTESAALLHAEQLQSEPQLASLEQLCLRTYLRLEVPDRAGVLADLGRAFAAEGVSIASVLQAPHPERERSADLIITTHESEDGAVSRVLNALTRSESVIEIGVRLRIEDAA